MNMREEAAKPRKVVVVPVYWVAVSLITVAFMVIVSVVISVALANRNAHDLVARYESDKRATGEANRQFYCTLFGTQLDAFENATSEAGKKSYSAWLGVYRLAECRPLRK